MTDGTGAFTGTAVWIGQVPPPPSQIDGSPSFSCAWVTAKSDSCSYPYLRSSVNGSAHGADGAPAYNATGAATWTVRFEANGAPVTIAGAPAVLTGPAMSSPVEVAEVQTIVTGTS
jgi:hypothetical protein